MLAYDIGQKGLEEIKIDLAADWLQFFLTSQNNVYLVILLTNK